ncbi:hypothetical protein HCN51_45750 [Nonomuraea sp. FMUSA5-5]|uniref:Uncharacterized protein n=1 Tax=Nonomuraea composti TaxID=2720023 RepID=A0ABX1BPG5_9ACTN|nr:hypothetical protein [Nonomuraea sp. FMUSA5-5]NJP96658.1 hypothetical protein [Nonomuraea sp. FMUSA5-5]
MSQEKNPYSGSRAHLPDQAAITWVHGLRFDELIETLGGDSAGVTPACWDDVEADAVEHYGESRGGVLLAARHEDWTILVEPLDGVATTLIERLSIQGRALTVRWTTNLATTVGYAAKGTLIALFDPMNLESVAPASGREWLHSLSVPPAQWRQDWYAAALTLGETLSGVRLDRAWWARRHLKIALHPGPASAVLPRLNPPLEHRRIIDADPRLAEIVNDPTPERLHDLIQLAVEQLMPTPPPSDGPFFQAWELIVTRRRGERATAAQQRLRSYREELTPPPEALTPPAQSPYLAQPDDRRQSLEALWEGLMEKARLAVVLEEALEPDLAQAAVRTTAAVWNAGLADHDGSFDFRHVLHLLAIYMGLGEDPYEK